MFDFNGLAHDLCQRRTGIYRGSSACTDTSPLNPSRNRFTHFQPLTVKAIPSTADAIPETIWAAQLLRSPFFAEVPLRILVP